MKKIYESFTEIAKDFVNRNNWTHQLSEHTMEECLPWQHGVCEFAKWLDVIGSACLDDVHIYDKLWDGTNMPNKPSTFVDCPKETI